MTSRDEEAWHSPLFWKKVVSRVSIVGFEACWKAGLCFLFYFRLLLRKIDVARRLLWSKRRAATVCFDRALSFIEQKRAWSSKLGLRCSIWFALDEWKIGRSLSVRISAGGMFELFGAMYIQSFTFRDVILAFVLYCQSNCRLSSLAAEFLWMEYCDWMKTSVEDVFFEIWRYVAKMSGIVF